MTDIATFTNEQLIAVCRADVAEMSKFLKEGEFSNPSRAAMYLRITEIALAALMGEFSFARNQVRREHAEWSQATFGNVGPVGPLNHLNKEALEAAEQPGDLSEWADMQFLLWDAQRRAGVTDEQITQAMIDKLAVNKQRKWPEPKDGEPRLHIKEQPAPVVPAVSDDIGEIRVGRLPTMNQDDYPGLGDWWVQLRIGEDSDEVLARVYGATPQEANNRAEALACRAAMLQELKKSAGAGAVCRSSDNAQVLTSINPAPTLVSLPKNAKSLTGNSPVIGIDLASGPDRTVEVHYVVPPGYVVVPKEPTDEMIAAAMNCEDVLFNSDDSFCIQFVNIYEAMLAAAPKEVK